MSVSDIDGSRSVGYMCFKNTKENNEVDMGMEEQRIRSKLYKKRGLMKQASVNKGTAKNIKAANVCVHGHGCCCNLVTRIRWVAVGR